MPRICSGSQALRPTDTSPKTIDVHTARLGTPRRLTPRKNRAPSPRWESEKTIRDVP
jgi:hypothetical protein